MIMSTFESRKFLVTCSVYLSALEVYKYLEKSEGISIEDLMQNRILTDIDWNNAAADLFNNGDFDHTEFKQKCITIDNVMKKEVVINK